MIHRASPAAEPDRYRPAYPAQTDAHPQNAMALRQSPIANRKHREWLQTEIAMIACTDGRQRSHPIFSTCIIGIATETTNGVLFEREYGNFPAGHHSPSGIRPSSSSLHRSSPNPKPFLLLLSRPFMFTFFPLFPAHRPSLRSCIPATPPIHPLRLLHMNLHSSARARLRSNAHPKASLPQHRPQAPPGTARHRPPALPNTAHIFPPQV
ncbi:uncharacterized protein V1516DRAFT_551371 [Lipomyces oligophaga]|uniref:uncharacterized protein n=1 Tax=Lipomyces oligophaga TaxID=45792 RepID=UPI0034CD740A